MIFAANAQKIFFHIHWRIQKLTIWDFSSKGVTQFSLLTLNSEVRRRFADHFCRSRCSFQAKHPHLHFLYCHPLVDFNSTFLFFHSCITKAPESGRWSICYIKKVHLLLGWYSIFMRSMRYLFS